MTRRIRVAREHVDEFVIDEEIVRTYFARDASDEEIARKVEQYVAEGDYDCIQNIIGASRHDWVEQDFGVSAEIRHVPASTPPQELDGPAINASGGAGEGVVARSLATTPDAPTSTQSSD